MRSLRYILVLFLVAEAVISNAQQTTYSLQQCLSIAIKNNLTAQQDSITAQTARIGFLQAKENLIPYITGGASRDLTTGRAQSSVTGTYITQSETSDNYSVNGTVTLFNGLALQSAIKQASYAYQSGKMAFQAAKDVVTVNVISNYLSVLDARDMLNQDTSQLDVAKESLDRSEILEQHGDNKFASDVYDLRGSYQTAKVNLVVAQNNLDAAMLNLFQLMNVPYDKTAVLQPLNAEDLKGDDGVNPDSVYNVALSQLAQMKAATLMRQSAESEVKYYRGLLYPQVYLGSGIATNYSNLNTNEGSYYGQLRNNYGTYIQLGLNIPIFTNLFRRNNAALAKLNLLNYQFIENNTRIVLKQSVEQAYYNMASAFRRYQALDEEVKAFSESFRISRIRYEAGVLNSVDFVTSKNNMDGAKLQLISARYDYIIYSKILDYYQGKLGAF